MFFYIRQLYALLIQKHTMQLENLSPREAKRAIDFEVNLWRNDDIETYMIMTTEMLQIDNCKIQIDLPVHHISVDSDEYS